MLFTVALFIFLPWTLFPAAPALCTQADHYCNEHNYEAAIPLYHQALEEAYDPSIAVSLAHAYYKADMPDKAVRMYKDIATKAHENEGLFYNIAYISRLVNSPEDAVTYYTKALKLNPQNSTTMFGLAKAYLALGNFEAAWPLFEMRFANNDRQRPYLALKPEDFNQKKVLVRIETWGLGDYIHFIRYAQLLHTKGALVYAQVPVALVALMKSCPYIHHLIPEGTQLPATDIQIPLLSLPLIFNTTLASIPTPIPYLFGQPELITLWEKQLMHNGQLNVGICWQGHHYYEAFNSHYAKKTLPLTALLPIFSLPNINFYSLQALQGNEQINALPTTIHLHHFENLDTEHGRFMDTAALISLMDIVITVDTAVAHLAGALGKTVWMLLPYTAEWRWMKDRTTSPWYPTMTLFRQQKPGDWSEPVAALCARLASSTKS